MGFSVASLLGLFMDAAFPLCVCVCVSVPVFKDPSHTGLGPSLMTSFYLSYLLKDPVSEWTAVTF